MALSVAETIRHGMIRRLVNNELEMMWKQVIVVSFEEACFPTVCLEGVMKTTMNLSQDCRSSGCDLNMELSEYEARGLTTRPRHSVMKSRVRRNANNKTEEP
jgi:hypothetical protein